mmetsp:Transcript_105910/g.228261  ORF Transcript_105910/g.228261 Transcript_105910/m.228261 type:complete len:210 (+) Transcript_105910:270-899(+)
MRGQPNGDVDLKTRPMGKFQTTSFKPPPRSEAEAEDRKGEELEASCETPLGAPDTRVQSAPCCTANTHISGPEPPVPICADSISPLTARRKHVASPGTRSSARFPSLETRLLSALGRSADSSRCVAGSCPWPPWPPSRRCASAARLSGDCCGGPAAPPPSSCCAADAPPPGVGGACETPRSAAVRGSATPAAEEPSSCCVLGSAPPMVP